MTHRLVAAFFAFALSMLPVTAPAAIVIGDGSLADWGLTVVNDGSFSELPANTTNIQIVGQFTSPGGMVFSYALEDQKDSEANYLGPNGGGQANDVEFLGVAFDLNFLYIAIVTGVRPDIPEPNFAPGDILIRTNLGIFGVEVGGGVGGSTAHDGAIVTNDPGTTYYVNEWGIAQGALNTNSTHGISTGLVTPTSAGSVWLGANWLLDPFDNQNGDANFLFDGYQPVQMNYGAGNLVGMANYAYTWNSTASQHAIIEVAIPLSYFNGSTISDVQWSMGCGNDVLRVSESIETTSAVPEPTSLSMAFAGLVGFVGFARRARRSMQ
jgi:hypothetical protein